MTAELAGKATQKNSTAERSAAKIAEQLNALGAPQNGLATAEVNKRLAQYGPNALEGVSPSFHAEKRPEKIVAHHEP